MAVAQRGGLVARKSKARTELDVGRSVDARPLGDRGDLNDRRHIEAAARRLVGILFMDREPYAAGSDAWPKPAKGFAKAGRVFGMELEIRIMSIKARSGAGTCRWPG